MRKKLVLITIVLALASLGIVASLFAQDTATTTERAYLGVGLVESNSQVVISRVMNASPADQAALLIGDVIISVNGTAVTTALEVSDLINTLAGGDVVTLEIERQGEAQTVEATLISLPASAMDGGRRGNRDGFGFFGHGDNDMDDMFEWHGFGNMMPFMGEEMLTMPIPADQTMSEMLLGADLTEVADGQEVVSVWSTHTGLDLQAGDIITSVNGTPVAELDLDALHTDLLNMETPALTMEITRAGDPMTLTAELPMMMEMNKMHGGRGGNFLFGFGMGGGRHGNHDDATTTPAPEATEEATATPNA